MAILRAPVEAEAISELGPLMALAGKSVLTSGANPDLNGPLAFSLQALGITPTDPTAVSDADLAGLANGDFARICQLVEYFAIKKCLNSLVVPNEKAQDRSQDWNEMIRRFTGQMNALQAQYASLLSIVLQPMASGAYATNFPTPASPGTWGLGNGRVDH